METDSTNFHSRGLTPFALKVNFRLKWGGWIEGRLEGGWTKKIRNRKKNEKKIQKRQWL